MVDIYWTCLGSCTGKWCPFSKGSSRLYRIVSPKIYLRTSLTEQSTNPILLPNVRHISCMDDLYRKDDIFPIRWPIARTDDLSWADDLFRTEKLLPKQMTSSQTDELFNKTDPGYSPGSCPNHAPRYFNTKKPIIRLPLQYLVPLCPQGLRLRSTCPLDTKCFCLYFLCPLKLIHFGHQIKWHKFVLKYVSLMLIIDFI